MYESQKIHIVTETVDGKPVETRLPKEQAETLFRKIRKAGGTANVQKELLEQVEKPYIPAFEIEV